MRVDFVKLVNLGYPRIIPVIPPGAPLPEDATRELQGARGKVPGLRLIINGRPAPTFTPLPRWRDYQITEQDARWHTETECNAGLTLGALSNLYCLDLDITDPRITSLVHQRLGQLFGRMLPYRIGNAPKAAYYFRVPPGSPSLRRVRIKFNDPTGTEHLIELLGEGQQSVIAGVHPKTGGAYAWVLPGHHEPSFMPPHVAELPELPIDRLASLPSLIMDALTSLIQCTVTGAEGRMVGSGTYDQAALLAPDIEVLRAAVADIPNTHAQFPLRADYLNMAYAIKAAAGPEREAEAFLIFLDWCERWDGGTNEYETCASDWRRVVPPYRVGWNWLIHRARQAGVELGGFAFENAPPLPEGEALPDDAPARIASHAVPYSQYDCVRRITTEHQWAHLCIPSGPRTFEWLAWDGTTWRPDDGMIAIRSVIMHTAAHMASQLVGAEPTAAGINRARGLQAHQFQNGVLQLLNICREFSAAGVRFDAHPWVLNTPAGIVNLQSGAYMPHDPRQFCRCITNVSPVLNPSPDDWSFTRHWLFDVACEDASLMDFLLNLMALCITGYSGIQRWFVLLGIGANGKSTLLHLMLHMLGSYAIGANAETFQVQHTGKNYGLIKLKDKRLVVATEATGQATWNTSLLAALTGGDHIEAEAKYHQPEAFRPHAKIVIASNNMPKLRTIDNALVRRFTAVPFNRVFAQLDHSVPGRLELEAPAFLGHLIQRAAALYAGVSRGNPVDALFPLPPAVRASTGEHLAMQDVLGEWLETRVIRADGAFTPTRLLHQDFTASMLEKHDRNWPLNVFSMELSKRNLRWDRITRAKISGFHGIALRPFGTDAFSDAPELPPTNVISIRTGAPIGLDGKLGDEAQ